MAKHKELTRAVGARVKFFRQGQDIWPKQKPKFPAYGFTPVLFSARDASPTYSFPPAVPRVRAGRLKTSYGLNTVSRRRQVLRPCIGDSIGLRQEWTSSRACGAGPGGSNPLRSTKAASSDTIARSQNAPAIFRLV